jgi:hypothetical protein
MRQGCACLLFRQSAVQKKVENRPEGVFNKSTAKGRMNHSDWYSIKEGGIMPPHLLALYPMVWDSIHLNSLTSAQNVMNF